MTRPIVVFDLDGTLVDSAPGIMRVLDEMRAARDLQPCAIESVRHWISLGAPELIKAALEVEQDGVAEALGDFRARYGRATTLRKDMYPGTDCALDRLHGAGARMGVCSNKPHALTEKVLSDLHIRVLFDGVAGGDAIAACKPDPRHLQETLRRMDCDGKSFFYVGDSVIDADAADGIGARFLWISYGYGEAVDLAHRGIAVYCATDIADIVLGSSA